MVNDVLDRIREALGEADTTDWITAIIIGVVVQLVVLVLLKVAGIFFRIASWVFATVISVFVAYSVLDGRGLPESIGGRRIEDWIDDARRAVGG